VTPATTTVGAVFRSGVTLTVNVAGAKLNVPAVVFDVSLTVTVVEPLQNGVTGKIPT